MDQNANQSPMPQTPNENPGDTGTGYLTVQVTAAHGAIPLSGARVEIRSYGQEDATAPSTRGDTVASLVSGADGKTATIPLSAPPASRSADPGVQFPFARYQADVYLAGYRRQSYIGIPVFDGVTSLQGADLVPLPEDGSGGSQLMEPQLFQDPGFPEL